jgi:hypothetical protein
MQKFYRVRGRYLVRRPPSTPRPRHVRHGDVRSMWIHVARLREAAGDFEGARRARTAASASVLLGGDARVRIGFCQYAPCDERFLIRSPAHKYCSARCRHLDTSPAHLARGPHYPRHTACGGATSFAEVTLDVARVKCGNCKRTESYQIAAFIDAWMPRSW